MQSNRVGWPTHNWWLLIFLFVYLQIIKSMWRVGMCEKNCRLSSLKLDCLSKKHSFPVQNYSGLNPDLKVKQRKLNLKRRASSAGYRSKFSFPKPKRTRNIILHCSPIAVGVSFVSALSAVSLIPTCQISCPPSISPDAVRTVLKHSSAGNTARHLSGKHVWSRQPHTADLV